MPASCRLHAGFATASRRLRAGFATASRRLRAGFAPASPASRQLRWLRSDSVVVEDMNNYG
eukprot:1547564-Prymnesium_polylepis.1